MTAYSPVEWTDLFVAAAGAAAALTGLVFVAVSINIQRILEYPGLPERALATLLLLLGAVVVAITCLIPGMSNGALGTVLVLEALLLLAALSRVSLASLRADPEGRRYWLSNTLILAPGAVPFLIGALSVLAESGGGLYWIVAGVVGAIAGAVLNAWVLLVEILR